MPSRTPRLPALEAGAATSANAITINTAFIFRCPQSFRIRRFPRQLRDFEKEARKRCTQHGAEFRDCHYHSGQKSIVDRALALDCNEVATSQKEKDAESMPTRLYRVTAASFF